MDQGHAKIEKAYLEIFKGDYEKAIEAFKEAIEFDPSNASFYYKLSITCARSNKLDIAVQAAEMAHSLDPNEPKYKNHYDTLCSRQLCYQAHDLLEDPYQTVHAVTLLKKAVHLDPLNENAYLFLGLAYARMRDYVQAEHYIKKLLRLHPEHSVGKRLIIEYQSNVERNAPDDGEQPTH